jgi:SAM-dependent methyltransferase
MSVREIPMSSSPAPILLHRLRCDDGRVLPVPVERWLSDPSAEEVDVLARAVAPVLDVGCGPARHTATLVRRGVPALGIDVAASAVSLARRRGAPVLRRSVFDPLPGEGAWATALLLDGNIGIGGAPGSLMRRLRELLRDDGRVLTEVERPGVPSGALRVRIEGRGRATSWFPWALVGADRLGWLADRTGFDLTELWTRSGRWFARLDAR